MYIPNLQSVFGGTFSLSYEGLKLLKTIFFLFNYLPNLTKAGKIVINFYFTERSNECRDISPDIMTTSLVCHYFKPI